MQENGESDTEKLERPQESLEILERSWKRVDVVNVDVLVDVDWARGPERKSTSGGTMMMNGTVVKHWSRTQATRALSTAEAENYAVITGAAEALAMQSMLMAVDVNGHGLERASSSLDRAKAIVWTGLGKTRHVELRYLWLLDTTKTGRVKM